MGFQHHSVTAAKTVAMREAAQIRSVIADLNRNIALLEADITAEEGRTKNYDPSHFAYSIFAQGLRMRRGNLEATVEALQRKLAAVGAPDLAEMSAAEAA